MNEYTKILKQWCDRLIELQITNVKDPTVYGGIICPSCSRIHGRIADAVYPMTLLYHRLGDEKYLNCAKLLIDWSEYNLTFENGYNNDKVNNWRCTSIFAGIALGNTLMHHAECLDKKTFQKWKDIFLRLSEFIYDFYTSGKLTAHINYFASIPHFRALAYMHTGKKKYKKLADELATYVKKHFNCDNLLSGEGPLENVTKKGYDYVDIGYNVEESIPALVNYAHLLGYKDEVDFYAEKFKAHIEFMLPDGAWDNTFGTRACKWTYWGSRTSDGCQTGLVHLAELNPIFAEAAQRNFELYKKCTYNGLLYGGKMYIDSGEEACVHHTFCHAKAIAEMIDYNFKHTKNIKLPREEQYGLKSFETIGVRLINIGNWSATVCDSDSVIYKGAAASGGSLCLLWHNKTGVIFSSSMSKYNRLIEPTNMQDTRNWIESECCTLRIENGDKSSNNDIFAKCTDAVTEKNITVTTKGLLRDIEYNSGNTFSFTYTFCEDAVLIKATAENNADIIFPVIGRKENLEIITDTHFYINRDNAKIQIKSDFPLIINNSRFSLIGGFEFIPLTASGFTEINFEIKVL